MAYSSIEMQKVIPLRNNDYYDYLTYHIEQAQNRIWANIFIVNALQGDDPELAVRNLCKLLGAATYRGVDVRILVGDSNRTIPIKGSNFVSASLMKLYKVRVQKVKSTERSSTHDKFVLIDNDLVLVGSHNWTHRAFNLSEEDSIGVYSEDLSKRMRDQFLQEWNAAKLKGGTNEG